MYWVNRSYNFYCLLVFGIIFNLMRDRSFIFSLSFAILFCYLNVHPLLTKMETEIKMSREQSCSKSCSGEPAQPEENDCGSDGCNPFLPCSIGYCCYLPEGIIVLTEDFSAAKQKLPIFNDNRIRSGISECWHPPEA